MGKFSSDGDHASKMERKPFRPNGNNLAHIRGPERIAYGKALFRKKQEKERLAKIHEKASMLRNYARLCKREGIVSDRVHLGPKEEKSADETRKVNKRQPNSILEKEYEQAKKLKQQKAEEEEAERLRIERNKIEKEKKRKEENRKRMQKTKKGQPILGNQIKNLLAKIQS